MRERGLYIMKIEIYRKRSFPNNYIVDDEPETVFHNVSWVEITNQVIFGNIEGEELTIIRDNSNYKYIIKEEAN